MIYLISGASHTGKTLMAQKLMETIGVPYVSIDHIKMGLIRSGLTNLTPENDDKLTSFLWPIVREMIKTAIENNQNMIIEGCYIPFTWQEDFADEYLNNIKYICLIFSKEYIENNLQTIADHANVIENRLDDYTDKSWLISENEKYLAGCKAENLDCVLIEERYSTGEIIATIINWSSALEENQ